MKYTYKFGPVQLDATVDSVELGTDISSFFEAYGSEIDATMRKNLLSELYAAYVKETHTTVVNEEPFQLTADALNAVLNATVSNYTNWLNSYGLLDMTNVTVTQTP